MGSKRLKKPSFLEESDYMEDVGDNAEHSVDLNREEPSEYSLKRQKIRKNKRRETLHSDTFYESRSEVVERGVLKTLISSLKKKQDDENDFNSISEKKIKKTIKTRRKEKNDINNVKVGKKKKERSSETVNMSNLFEKIDKIMVSKENENTLNDSQRDLSNMFNLIDAKFWSDDEHDCDNNAQGAAMIDTEDDLINLTDLEKAMLPEIKECNSKTGINEWLPSMFMELKSEVVRKLNDETILVDNKVCEFFYSQWMEQYSYMSTLTQNFNRDIQNCFVLKGQIPSISKIRESNENLLLDPEDDKMPFAVQDLDGRVILNVLVHIANLQQKHISEMNKENKYGENADDYKYRKEYGVISRKARQKLWWLCRMAEHCGLIGREGKKMRYYLVQESDCEEEADAFISANAAINSSVDLTMAIFDQDEGVLDEKNRLKEIYPFFSDRESAKNNANGDLFDDEDNYEGHSSSQDPREEDGLNNQPNEIEIKWSELSSLTVSNRTRPWERKRTTKEQIIVEKPQEKIKEEDISDSKTKLFKFMLKNIGPRPLWTEKNPSLEKVSDKENKIGIEIEPPNNLSLREQGQLKIKWIQMRSQAEKLAIHHFKIIDPETNELDTERLKYWSDLFNINLFIPDLDFSKTKSAKTKELGKISISESFENDGQNNPDNSIHSPKPKNSLLPLDIEYTSGDEGSSVVSNEIDYEKDQSKSENKTPISESEELKLIDEFSKYKASEAFDTKERENVDETCEHDFETSQRKVEESNSEKDFQDFPKVSTGKITDNESSEEYDQEILEKRSEAYKKYLAIRNNRRKLKKKVMERYGHLLEDEAEESDEDGIKVLRRGMEEEENFEDYSEDLDWDELSGFSDFIDDEKYENELDGDAIQAHLKHMKQIEERQYRQLFTLEGLRERKNKAYGLSSEIQDDEIDLETRLEKRNNEIHNPVFFDDVISEYWTDEEDYESLSDEEINERNMVDILGIDYDDWQKENMRNEEVKSSDESINIMRREKYIKLKNALLKEASSQIHLLQQRFHNLEEKMKNDISEAEKASLREKYIAISDKLRGLLKSIHNSCKKCIYENHQYFDHIDISKYIQKRQESRLLREKNSKKGQNKSKKHKIRNNAKNIDKRNDISNYSGSEDELVANYKFEKKNKNILNIRGARFVIDSNQANKK